MINTGSNFSSLQDFKKTNGPFESKVKITTHTKDSNSPEGITEDYESRAKFNNTTLNQSQSYNQSPSNFIKPGATIRVKPNLRASMAQMNTTRNNLSKGFIFKDPLDDIVTRKKKKISHMKSNSLY